MIVSLISSQLNHFNNNISLYICVTGRIRNMVELNAGMIFCLVFCLLYIKYLRSAVRFEGECEINDRIHKFTCGNDINLLPRLLLCTEVKRGR